MRNGRVINYLYKVILMLLKQLDIARQNVNSSSDGFPDNRRKLGLAWNYSTEICYLIKLHICVEIFGRRLA